MAGPQAAGPSLQTVAPEPAIGGLDTAYERDRKVWDACARTYERQIVGGHPDVTAYEDFEEDLLDRILLFLTGEQDLDLRLFDVGCGSARLHRRLGMRLTEAETLPEADAGQLQTARAATPGRNFDPLLAKKLKVIEGLDFSTEMIGIAREKLVAAGLATLLGTRLKLVQGSAFDLKPMDAEPVPVLVSVCNSIGVMQGPEGAVALFQSMRRAVEAAGGIAIISAYCREAVASHALGNYETTLDVCGQPRWLEPDTYAGGDYQLIPRSYKRAHSTDPGVRVDVLDTDGGLVQENFELRRNSEAAAQTVASGHIQTHTDYESRWYGFDQFAQWMDEYWGGLKHHHLAGKHLDALRGEPAQFAILDPRGLLTPLVSRWDE